MAHRAVRRDGDAVSRIEAATRLGTPIVVCDECGVPVVERDALFTGRTDRGNTVIDRVHFCSLNCIEQSTFRGMDVRAWKINPKYGDAIELGARSLHSVDHRWVWTDVGEARWIEENIARLRAAGENL